MKKKIAFLSFDWNNEVVSQYINGVEKFLKDHEDVVLHIFDGIGNIGNYEAQKGSLQIFELPDLENYDGLIIEGNRSWKPEDRQAVADRARAYGVPVVSINYPLNGCMNVSSDNEESEYQIVSHVIQEHGVRNIAFVRGLDTSLETRDREKGFLRAVRENDIEHYRIMDGSWDQKAGSDAVRRLLGEGVMPEAIICSNDDAAYGAVEELKKRKYRVPENVIVTGFDNLNIAEASDPRITTVSRNYAGMAYAALDLILVSMKSTEIRTGEMKIPGELIKGTSCGCGDYRQEIQDIKRKYASVYLKVKMFYRIHDDVERALDHAGTLPEIADLVEGMVGSLTEGNFWMVMNGDYLDGYHSTETVRSYGDHMYLYAVSDGSAHSHDENHIYEPFSGKKILPDRYHPDERTLEIYPLHFDETVIGYVVMDSLIRQQEPNFPEALLVLLESAIEHVHDQYIQQSLNTKLSLLYVTDQQTGLYNRFGMEQNAKSYYEKRLKQNLKTYVTFLDVDGMKKINDRYGHDAGDRMIDLTADALRHALKGTDDIAVRYGGDEFVVLSDDNVKEKITEALVRLAVIRKIPWHCSVSAGTVSVVEKDHLTLKEAVSRADQEMYQAKKQLKDK